MSERSFDRRREDRATWPVRDRARWWLYKIGRCIRDRIVTIFVIVLIGLIGLTVAQQVRTEQRQDRADARQDRAALLADQRDEARKYQVCTQRVAGDSVTNLTVRVLRGAVVRTRRLRIAQAERTTDPVLKRAFLRSAAGYLRDSRLLVESQLTDCRRTYGRGFELSSRFPDLAPAAPPSRTDGPTDPAPKD